MGERLGSWAHKATLKLQLASLRTVGRGVEERDRGSIDSFII